MSMHGAAQPATLTCPKCSGDMRIQRFPENDAYRASSRIPTTSPVTRDRALTVPANVLMDGVR